MDCGGGFAGDGLLRDLNLLPNVVRGRGDDESSRYRNGRADVHNSPHGLTREDTVSS